MTGLVEVLVLTPADAQRAAAGGADRVEVIGSLEFGGMSPDPELVEKVRDAVDLEIRVRLRLREGFSTDGGEFARLRGLAASYLDAGADGIVMGFLNGREEIDTEVLAGLLAGVDWPWTFHRAFDSVLDPALAWTTLLPAPGLDQVQSAGSPRGLAYGLDELIAFARSDRRIAALAMAGGGLLPEHVPWLARARITAFHLAEQVRPHGSFREYVDPDLVGSWRRLVDAEVARAYAGRTTPAQ
ncbi:copper homeostasis protein CutC [Granulicoccus phenolivorans]|uniref:copper homeostasis protein CutC n=1 Tax=Granulicoccus phenolivorans TaxID=266854 RepID=UPI0004276E18|nr:copper homeostasis protein CutC [Granulicoccus phenolivorans]